MHKRKNLPWKSWFQCLTRSRKFCIKLWINDFDVLIYSRPWTMQICYIILEFSLFMIVLHHEFSSLLILFQCFSFWGPDYSQPVGFSCSAGIWHTFVDHSSKTGWNWSEFLEAFISLLSAVFQSLLFSESSLLLIVLLPLFSFLLLILYLDFILTYCGFFNSA